MTKALEKKVEERYPTAKELLEALENWKLEAPESGERTKTISREPPKSVLGFASPADEKEAQELARRAFDRGIAVCRNPRGLVCGGRLDAIAADEIVLHLRCSAGGFWGQLIFV